MNPSPSTYDIYLCEKPSQGRDIARVLGVRQRQEGYLQGKGIIVTWCIGHLLEMANPDAYDAKYKRWSLADLPIVPGQWQMRAKKSTRKQLTIIGRLLKKAHRVIIATDADREGETIAREVLKHFGFKGQTSRLWLSALDPVSIQRALKTQRDSQETKPLYFSGLARGRADWLIGMNLTRAFTLKANDRQLRSVGRVQTPTLSLVVKRDREIEHFVPQAYYEVRAWFLTVIPHDSANKTPPHEPEQHLLETLWQVPQSIADAHKHCINKQQAQSVIDRCRNKNGRVSEAKTERKRQPPPLLFNLSALQQEASRRWGFGAQDVLTAAQSLYETHKLITYPRSDCEYLPLSQHKDASLILQAISKNDPQMAELISQCHPQQRSRVWNDCKITAHHAIIPTQAHSSLEKLNTKEKHLYDIVKRRYIAQFYPDYEYDQSIIVVTIGQDKFKASGRIKRVNGWKTVINDTAVLSASEIRQPPDKEQGSASLVSTRSATSSHAETELPAVNRGDSLPCKQLETRQKQTNPPRYFTEGTLIRAMESIGLQVNDKVLRKILRETAGLGTQATRANIIQTLFQREFIKKEKKLIKATPLGCQLIDRLPDSIKDPVLTAQWEQQLDDIASGKTRDIDSFLQQQISLVKAILHQSENLPGPSTTSTSKDYQLSQPCPACGQPLEMRTAVKGQRVGQNYIGCSHFPACRFYHWPED